MTFINEYIKDSDLIEYDIEAINRRYAKNNYKPDWTIDREQDIYLRDVFYGRDEDSANTTYTFFWKGNLIELKLNEKGGTNNDRSGWSHYVLLKFKLPPHLEPKRDQILSDLKDALAARKGGGIYSKRVSSTETFDF